MTPDGSAAARRPTASPGEGVGRLGPGARVVVTGADGFIGSALTRTLLARGADVTAMVEPGGPASTLAGLDVRFAEADVRDAAAVRRAVAGSQVVFHVAALYRFWAPDRTAFYDVNVGGTRTVLEAAVEAGCERVVYTSTVGTIGVHAARRDEPVDETSYPTVDHLFGAYKQSKYVAEHEVLRAAAEGAPVVIVQPTTPVGPRDVAPTPTGRMVLDFLDGRLPGTVDTTLNVVAVDDVAEGHVLAAERGRNGRSYILGGENLSLADVVACLAAATKLPRPAWRVPRRLAVVTGWVSEVVEGRFLGRAPRVPLEGALMATTHMAFDDRRARAELGYCSRPASEALAEAARWFVETGRVRPERVAVMDPAWADGAVGGDPAQRAGKGRTSPRRPGAHTRQRHDGGAGEEEPWRS